ncbi:MAG: hypothetical protein ACKVOJ_05015, partial [Sphingomonadaceae bacterium]
GGSWARARYPPSLAIWVRQELSVFNDGGGWRFWAAIWLRSSTAADVSASVGVASGAARLIIVIQKIR